MRVRDTSTKAISIIAGYALAVLAAITVGLSTQSAWGVVAGSVIVLLLVLVLSRLFRGENESDAPRSWWRMTARPPAGYALGCWFGAQAIASITTALLDDGWIGWTGGVVSLSIAALYLNSAIRLSSIRS
ncbi:hypothetical protein [Cryocola sp. 340MFSha3.1]|uniref:hypothetical protein n=1 Tax=Cryocola sp. 340MFSha3.1 TaxID=1169145 RepID=UPI00036F578D|nr:hypothetical protein [Cryocola sp. 340MFSha3.1]